MAGKNTKQSRRLGRVSSRMKFLIGEVLRREMNDPRLGFLTVLGVELTEDLKEAKVFLSVLGTRGDRSKTEHALESARGFIQREVGRNLETRSIPTLRFVFDDSMDKASKIEALLHKVSQEDREANMAKRPSGKPDTAGEGAGIVLSAREEDGPEVEDDDELEYEDDEDDDDLDEDEFPDGFEEEEDDDDLDDDIDDFAEDDDDDFDEDDDDDDDVEDDVEDDGVEDDDFDEDEDFAEDDDFEVDDDDDDDDDDYP